MEWMQALAIIASMIGSVVGLGFLFRKSIDRLDRNFEMMQKEMRDFHIFMRDIHGRVSVLEKKK